MIVFKNVTKSYDNHLVLNGVSFRIDPEEMVCITGPSGVGKTTVVSMIIGAEEPTKGTVEVDGVDLRMVPADALQLYRRRVGVVFQDFKLLPHLTVAENIAFPLEACGAPDEWIETHVKEVLIRLKMEAYAKAFPHQLSGGEKARTAIARAIVHKPLIVIADEPTGTLDPVQAVEILELLKEIHKEKTTVIVSTHDFALVDTLQTRVIRLEQGTVARDTVGGYDKPKKAQPKKHPEPAKHEFFEAESKMDIATKKEEPAAPAPAPESGTSGAPPARKVKITSIGSDAPPL
jgi:cell division transport system ATP-binding protein